MTDLWEKIIFGVTSYEICLIIIKLTKIVTVAWWWFLIPLFIFVAICIIGISVFGISHAKEKSTEKNEKRLVLEVFNKLANQKNKEKRS